VKELALGTTGEEQPEKKVHSGKAGSRNKFGIVKHQKADGDGRSRVGKEENWGEIKAITGHLKF
jgi:hypothetical protein